MAPAIALQPEGVLGAIQAKYFLHAAPSQRPARVSMTHGGSRRLVEVGLGPEPVFIAAAFVALAAS